MKMIDRRLIVGGVDSWRRLISAASSVNIAPRSRQVTFVTGCGRTSLSRPSWPCERRIDRAAVEEVEPARLRADRRMLRGDARSPTSSSWPAPPRRSGRRSGRCCRSAGGRRPTVGSLIAIASPSQAESALGGSGHSVASSRSFEQRVLAHVGRQVALEDDRRRLVDVAARGTSPGSAPGTSRGARPRARRPGRGGSPRSCRWRRCRSPRRAGSAAGRPCCPRSGSGGRRPRCTAGRSARPSGRAWPAGSEYGAAQGLRAEDARACRRHGPAGPGGRAAA